MIRYLLSILGIGKKGVAQLNQRRTRVDHVPNYKLILYKNALFFVSSNYWRSNPGPVGITMLAGVSPNRDEPSGWRLEYVSSNHEVEEKIPPDTIVYDLNVSYIPIGDPRNIHTIDGVPIADLFEEEERRSR